MRKYLAIILLFATALATSACNAPPENGVTTFVLAHASPEDTVTGLVATRFADLVYEQSAGTMVVEVFPNSQLGGDVEILTNLATGQIDFIVGTTAPQVGTIPSLALFDLPNIFATEQIARTVFDDDVFMDLIRAEYQAHGFLLLGYADQSYRVMSANRPIHTLDDFQGILIRTMQNPFHMAYWQALGAVPTPMAFSEVFVALQQRTIDAQENPLEVIVANAFYEVQDYIILTNHLLHIIAIVTNDAAFHALPPAQQAVILDATAAVIPWARDQADLRVQDRLARIAASGVTVLDLSPALLDAMQQALSPVRDHIRTAVGDVLYDALFSAIARAE